MQLSVLFSDMEYNNPLNLVILFIVLRQFWIDEWQKFAMCVSIEHITYSYDSKSDFYWSVLCPAQC